MDSVVVHQLSKGYGAVKAVEDLTFSVEEGELFGFIGPDGAGKTTLFRMLVTLLKPDAGEAFVDGLHVVKDFKELRRRLGYMPGRFSLYQDLSVQENLTFFATIFGTTVKANYDLIKDIYQQIEPFKHRKAGKLSGGMKQKLALSCALVHRPRVLFLDEPTTGVDAVSRREFWDMLKRLKAEGITIMVSTPYMDEASLCDRVALIQKGHILNINTPAALQGQYQRPLLAVKASRRYELLQALRAYPQAYTVYPFGDSLHYTDAGPEANVSALVQYLHDSGFADAQVEPIAASIEDVFMALMMEEEVA